MISQESLPPTFVSDQTNCCQLVKTSGRHPKDVVKPRRDDDHVKHQIRGDDADRDTDRLVKAAKKNDPK